MPTRFMESGDSFQSGFRTDITPLQSFVTFVAVALKITNGPICVLASQCPGKEDGNRARAIGCEGLLRSVC